MIFVVALYPIGIIKAAVAVGIAIAAARRHWAIRRIDRIETIIVHRGFAFAGSRRRGRRRAAVGTIRMIFIVSAYPIRVAKIAVAIGIAIAAGRGHRAVRRVFGIKTIIIHIIAAFAGARRRRGRGRRILGCGRCGRGRGRR